MADCFRRREQSSVLPRASGCDVILRRLSYSVLNKRIVMQDDSRTISLDTSTLTKRAPRIVKTAESSTLMKKNKEPDLVL